MFDLLNTDARTFLNAFKTAYYNDYGETLQIGSDEFAVASVYAYCMSIFFNQINENTKNRFLDTATGEFLNSIAAMYGIYERPSGYHATCMMKLTVPTTNITIPAKSIVVSSNNGAKFTNPYEIRPTTDPFYIPFQAVESGTKYNGIPAGQITMVEQGEIYIDNAENSTMTSGGTDGFSDDDVYREWLKTEIQSFAGCGTYRAYEAKAKNTDPRVLDVYVLRQDDTGYQKGSVKIFIITDLDQDNGDVVYMVENACNDPDFRPIGDEVLTGYAADTQISLLTTQIQVTYPKRFENIASDRNARIYAEYKANLQRHINAPFVFEDLCRLLVEKDADGVFAYDAKALNLQTNTYPEPIYPQAGHKLKVTGLEIVNVFSNKGA